MRVGASVRASDAHWDIGLTAQADGMSPRTPVGWSTTANDASPRKGWHVGAPRRRLQGTRSLAYVSGALLG